MKYLVMECKLSYAIVLDSEGRFLKVANLGYEPGQSLDWVVASKQEKTRPRLALSRKIAALACSFALLIGGAVLWQIPAGSVQIKINPQIQLSINHLGRVIELTALNQDAQALLEGYKGYAKSAAAAADELADRAIEQGYLKDGGLITLTAASSSQGWGEKMEKKLAEELYTHLNQKISIKTESEEYTPSEESQGGLSKKNGSESNAESGAESLENLDSEDASGLKDEPYNGAFDDMEDERIDEDSDDEDEDEEFEDAEKPDDGDEDDESEDVEDTDDEDDNYSESDDDSEYEDALEAEDDASGLSGAEDDDDGPDALSSAGN